MERFAASTIIPSPPPDPTRAAAGVIPRWEWRSVERRLPVALGRIQPPGLGPLVNSLETYILSETSPHSVKVRDGALEVKRIVTVNALGLELWQPTLRLRFPVQTADLGELWSAWGLRPPRGLRTPLTFGDLDRDVVRVEGSLTRVEVIKRRTKLDLGGCPAERVSMLIRERHWESLALEHEDPRRVADALQSLGLDPHANTSYPTALRRILGLPAPAHDATEEVY